MNREPVTVNDIGDLRRRLGRFALEFSDCFSRRPTHGHFQTYLEGQTSALQRKRVEPMALQAGVPPRTLRRVDKLWERGGPSWRGDRGAA